MSSHIHTALGATSVATIGSVVSLAETPNFVSILFCCVSIASTGLAWWISRREKADAVERDNRHTTVLQKIAVDQAVRDAENRAYLQGVGVNDVVLTAMIERLVAALELNKKESNDKS